MYCHTQYVAAGIEDAFDEIESRLGYFSEGLGAHTFSTRSLKVLGRGILGSSRRDKDGNT
jgi:hypothetical protein